MRSGLPLFGVDCAISRHRRTARFCQCSTSSRSSGRSVWCGLLASLRCKSHQNGLICGLSCRDKRQEGWVPTKGKDLELGHTKYQVINSLQNLPCSIIHYSPASESVVTSTESTLNVELLISSALELAIVPVPVSVNEKTSWPDEYKNASGRAFPCCFLVVSGLLEKHICIRVVPVTQFTILRGFNQPFLPTPTMLGVVIMQAFHHVTGRVDRRARRPS